MTNTNLNFILFFVENPLDSIAFYKKLFGIQPVEASATFGAFAFPNGMMLGLWSPKTAEPPASVLSGGCEIGLSEKNVDALYDAWVKLGVPMAQPPTDMDFGRTFVALDPDGHRIRVYKYWEEQ